MKGIRETNPSCRVWQVTLSHGDLEDPPFMDNDFPQPWIFQLSSPCLMTPLWQKYAKMCFVIKFKEFSSKFLNLFHFFPRASPLVGCRSPLTQLQLEKGHVAGRRSPVFGPNASQIPHPRWQKGGHPMKAVVSSSNKNT